MYRTPEIFVSGQRIITSQNNITFRCAEGEGFEYNCLPVGFESKQTGAGEVKNKRKLDC